MYDIRTKTKHITRYTKYISIYIPTRNNQRTICFCACVKTSNTRIISYIISSNNILLMKHLLRDNTDSLHSKCDKYLHIFTTAQKKGDKYYTLLSCFIYYQCCFCAILSNLHCITSNARTAITIDLQYMAASSYLSKHTMKTSPHISFFFQVYVHLIFRYVSYSNNALLLLFHCQC